MKRFTWWRMEQNAPHNARERWCASCSILHHVKRFMSQPPYSFYMVLVFHHVVIFLLLSDWLIQILLPF